MGVIGLVFFVIGFAELSASFFKHFGIDIKPFNCSFCLTFWYSLGIAYLWYTGLDLTIISFIGWTLITRQIAWRLLY